MARCVRNAGAQQPVPVVRLAPRDSLGGDNGALQPWTAVSRRRRAGPCRRRRSGGGGRASAHRRCGPCFARWRQRPELVNGASSMLLRLGAVLRQSSHGGHRVAHAPRRRHGVAPNLFRPTLLRRTGGLAVVVRPLVRAVWAGGVPHVTEHVERTLNVRFSSSDRSEPPNSASRVRVCYDLPSRACYWRRRSAARRRR